MRFFVAIFCSASLLALSSCHGAGVPTVPVSNEAQATPTAAPRCALVSEVIALKGKSQALPATGRLVEESHLVAKEDSPLGVTRWPSTTSDGVAGHITRSCTILKTKFGVKDCAKVYNSSYDRVWTPAEGGKIGQGSSSIPALLNEMFSGNMMWTAASKPKPGTKFLAQANGKSVVFNMGYETGPGDVGRWLGGVQPEVHYFLGTSNSSQIKIGRLRDQSLSVGPISCL